MTTTHHGVHLTRTQRLNRVGATLLIASTLSFATAAMTGSNIVGGSAIVFLFLGGWAFHKADQA